MKKKVIYVFVILLVGLIVISGCEQYVGRKISRASFDNLSLNKNLQEGNQLSSQIQQSFTLQNKEEISTRTIKRSFNEDTTVNLNYNQPIKSFGVDGRVTVNNDGYIIIILHGKNDEEILVFDSILFDKNKEVNLNEICEESCVLTKEVIPDYLEIKMSNANLYVNNYVVDRGRIDDIQQTTILKENLHEFQKQIKIDRMNEIIREKGANWVAGDNFLLDLSYSERKKYLGLENYDLNQENIQHDDGERDVRDVRNRIELPPRAFDWRNNNGNWMTPVKNQGGCGSCWAFAGIAAIEAWYNIKNNDPDLDLDLSEQDPVSCINQMGGYGCNGGNSAFVFTLAIEQGITDEECFPYEAKDYPEVSCNDKCENPPLYYIDNAGSVSNNPDMIKRAILSSPIANSFSVYQDFLYYNSGIYEYVEGEILGGHAVVGVGWGYEQNRLFWIEKNSWGSNWGEDGFFRIYEGESGIGRGALSILNFKNDSEVSCNDMDEGIDIYNKSDCYSYFSASWDICTPFEGGLYLIERYCGTRKDKNDGIPICLPLRVDCPHGCSNSMCALYLCDEEYFMTWYNQEERIRQEEYNILEDQCEGFRCLSNNNEISPSCYNSLYTCERNCDIQYTSNICLDIDEWKQVCRIIIQPQYQKRLNVR